MPSWINLESLPCALLMAAAAVLLALRPREPFARRAWLTLMMLGLVHAVGMSLLPENLSSRNVVHYYLGAKYDFPYRSFYELTSAATDRPQIFMHDLDHPPGLVRDDPSEQRGYFIDLLRAEQSAFDPLSSLTDLQRLAEESGAVRREGQRILRDNLHPDQIESFCEDVKTALVNENPDRHLEGIGNDITLDFGYNGSPFYSLVRHLDPSLYFPFSHATSVLNLVWQVAALLASVWLIGLALGAGSTTRIAMATLVFASWDYVAWDLPGLSFAGFWLPTALALWAISRCRPVMGGVAVAWAGLIKLFPFALLLLPAVETARAAWRRSRGSSRIIEWHGAPTLIAAALIAALFLTLVSLLSGRSWFEFIDKIVPQFSSAGFVANNVSLNQLLLVFGIHESPLGTWLSVAALGAVVFFLWKTEAADARVRVMLITLACLPWFVRLWFNYYAVAPLFLLPLVAERRRIGAAVGALSLAVVYFLPAFDDPILTGNRLAWLLKVLPYLAVPAWLAVVEFGPLFSGRTARRWALGLTLATVTLIGGEAIRQSMIRQYDAAGGQYLDRGQAESALACYDSLLGIAPLNPMAHMSRGICLAEMRRFDEAETCFRRAAELAPRQPDALLNLARLLEMRGKFPEASEAVEKALTLAPYDDAVWVVRARIASARGDRAAAGSLLARALELNPQNPEARALSYPAP